MQKRMKLQAEISPALQEASQWFAILTSDTLTDNERRKWNDWKNATVENANAWQQIEAINQQFLKVNPTLGLATLNLPNASRRLAIKQLSLILATGTVAYYGYQQQPWQAIMADYSTAVGEQKKHQLADGTQLYINTNSAVNIAYTQELRLVELIKGELFVDTRHDVLNRPFKVKTSYGLITALGTKFSVRDFDDYIQVSLFEGRVKVNPAQDHLSETTIQAGQTITFNKNTIININKNHLTDAAWRKGFLVIYNMPLSEFVKELGRYHKGMLRCHPSIANLEFSGSFPISNTQTALSLLADTLPVKVEKFTRFWTVINPV